MAWSGQVAGRRGAVELSPVDLTDDEATRRALAVADPEVIVHAAALSRAEEVRRDLKRGGAVNVAATWRLAHWCLERGRRLVYTSTDLVFAGSRAWYREDDPPEPIVAYGRTKHGGEAGVLAVPQGLVVRLSLLYGPTRADRPVFYDHALAALGRGEPQTFFEDEFRTPLDLATAARALARLATSDACGVVHLGGPERLSRFALMQRVARARGLDLALVHANRLADSPGPEPRPADVSLNTERLAELLPDLARPSIEEAVSLLHG
jgi:dTDP-4-dehydrorhamnose reductase